MKFFALASLYATVQAVDSFPPFQYFVWINPTGDITKPLTRCINVFSDDAAKMSEITEINKDVSEKIWLQAPANTTQRCETTSLVPAAPASATTQYPTKDFRQEMFVDVIPCEKSSTTCKIGTRIQYLAIKPAATTLTA